MNYTDLADDRDDKIIKALIGLILALSFMANSKAAGLVLPIALDQQKAQITPYQQILVLEDSNASLTPQQAYQQLLAGSGQALDTEVPNFGVTDSAYWFYFKLDKLTGDSDWNLLIEHHLIRELDLYASINDRDWQHRLESGTSRPWRQRSQDNAYFIYPLQNAANSTSFLLRLVNNDPLIVPLSFVTNQYLQTTLTRTLWVSGMYWGLLLALMTYNGFLYLSTERKRYLYYVIYNISFAGYLVIHEPWSHSFALSNFVWFSNHGIHLSIPFSMACALFFVAKFLNVQKSFPKTYNFFLLSIGWCIALMPLFPLIDSTLHTKLMLVSLQILSVFIIIVGFLSWRHGNQDAPFFLIAWSVLLAGAITTNLMYSGLLPFNWFTSSAATMGGSAEMLLLSFALAASINRLREQQKATESAHHRMLKEHVVSLDKSNQYKDNFLNVISHELRTPLHGIRASLDLAREKIDDKALIKEFEMLDNSAADMERRISDILVFTDLASGNFQLHLNPVNCRPFFQQLNDKFRPFAQDKNLEWQFSYADNLPDYLMADRQYLSLIYSQLLDNAIKFSDSGLVATFVDYQPDQSLLVTIKDSGIGIEPGYLKKLDKAFLQVDSSLKRNSGGLGLGLSLSQRLVEVMRGSIEIESELNQGTCVTVSIPIKAASPEAIAEYQPIVDDKAIASPSELSKGYQVLIVEDNLVNRKVLGSMVEYLGHSVSFSENGKLAVELCLREKFDLILMDCQMPIMDGIEATRNIRMNGVNQRTPILAVTANAMSVDSDICLSAGMNQYLPKPVRFAELAESIEHWLKN